MTWGIRLELPGNPQEEVEFTEMHYVQITVKDQFSQKGTQSNLCAIYIRNIQYLPLHLLERPRLVPMLDHFHHCSLQYSNLCSLTYPNILPVYFNGEKKTLSPRYSTYNIFYAPTVFSNNTNNNTNNLEKVSNPLSIFQLTKITSSS